MIRPRTFLAAAVPSLTGVVVFASARIRARKKPAFLTPSIIVVFFAGKSAVRIVKNMRPTILLVDDDADHLRLYSRGLSYAGFRPITALVGGHGVSFPEHETPEIVLLDYRFGGFLTPQNVARLIRASYPSALLILLSSVPELPADITGLVDGFIQKHDPVAVAEFVGIRLEGRKAKAQASSV
jgi:CheY-like chemotaxis protein